MFAAPPLITIIKYGFLSLVVTGAGFLIANTVVVTKHKNEAMEDLVYKAQEAAAGDKSNLNENFMRCLTHPNRPFCLISNKRRLEILENRHLLWPTNKTEPNGTISFETDSPQATYEFLVHFKDIMNSMNVKPVLLEPSILFCMLPPLQKYALISNAFNTSVLKGSPNVVTFGVFEKDSRIMNRKNSLTLPLQSGFKVSRALKWFKYVDGDLLENFAPTDFFYSKGNMTAHVLVFFQKENFLWHPGTSSSSFPAFVGPLSRNAIFENFSSVAMPLAKYQNQGFYYPSQTEHFLQQIQHSDFMECVPTATDQPSDSPSHPSLTKDQLNNRAQIAIQELKLKLKIVMGFIWLWRDTLSGWLEHCDLFQETTELNLAGRATTFSKLNLNRSLAEDEYLRFVESHQWEDLLYKTVLDCHGLVINIFAMYEDSDSVWYYEEISNGTLKKYVYPKFKLCSTSLMDQLVHTPCQNILTDEDRDI